MKRQVFFFCVLFVCVLSFVVPLAIAQNPQSGRDPTPSQDVIGTKLIVWSELQKPQPVIDFETAKPDSTRAANSEKSDVQREQQTMLDSTLSGNWHQFNASQPPLTTNVDSR